jgi:hypothetical protein
LETIVRAHQLVEEGYTYNFLNESLLTVWSAPNYYYRCGNRAAIVRIDQKLNKEFIQFEASADNDRHNVSSDNVLPYFL